MGPSIPSGRAARDAWRALSPQARKAAFAAARQGVVPPDVGLAWAAAGYGNTMARRLRILVLLAPLGVVLLLPTMFVAIGVTRGMSQVVIVAIPMVFVAYLVAVVTLSARMRRYQRLYNSGLLGVEAAQLGGPTPHPSPAVWATPGNQSEFTVPYGFTVPYQGNVPYQGTVLEPGAGPVAAAAARILADPVAAGVQVIPFRRGPLIFQLSLFGFIALVLWANAIVHLVTSGGAAAQVMAGVWVVLALIQTALMGFVALFALPALLSPVIARLTPYGWELPSAKLSGPWTEVREIRIRPLNVRRSRSAAAALAGFRAVALIVDHPDGYIARLSPLRRSLLRRTIRKFGSPAVIVATPRRTVPLVDLVRLLQRYTDAPVIWS